MHIPSMNHIVKALFLAVVLALLGYATYPLFAGIEAPRQLFTLGTTLGALIAVIVAGFSFAAGSASSARSAADSGEMKTVFVGNLAFKASVDDLRQLFENYGAVHSVRIMKDRKTRRPRGFAFVEMDAAGATKAIKKLDGAELLGRNLRVSEGSERKEERQAA